jgi:ubiquinone/menaquinone biosynthesis C-methylase UbiE
MSQKEQTQNFFDEISNDYSSKYEYKSAFHAYFFNQRLEKTTTRLNFENKNVLDIGSGTGNLYDHIKKQYPSVNFYATDISAGMLAQSNVLLNNKFHGNCYDIVLPLKEFDFITMLGVSTYMENLEINKTLQFVNKSLSNDGTFILTFTNRLSFDIILRNLFRWPLKLLKLKGRVIAGDFKIYTYSLKEAKEILRDFEIVEVGYLNNTIFPFSLILPKISISVAKFIESKVTSETLLSWLSSDFIIRVKKRH